MSGAQYGSPPRCPLCAGVDTEPFHQDPNRQFWRCPTCALVSVAPAQRPDLETERARYEKHHASAQDAGYVRFLQHIAEPVVHRVPVGSEGLDYGSGPSTVLADLLTQTGRPTVAYDPLFRKDNALLDRTYDFVMSCEVMEHVHAPAVFLARVANLVRPGGLFATMTAFYEDAESFAPWWYKRDITHVCFYHEATMQWIAHTNGWSLDLPATNVAVFRLDNDGV